MKWTAIVLISAWIIELVWLGWHLLQYRKENEN